MSAKTYESLLPMRHGYPPSDANISEPQRLLLLSLLLLLLLSASEILIPKGQPNGTKWGNTNNMKMMSRNISSYLKLPYPNVCIGY